MPRVSPGEASRTRVLVTRAAGGASALAEHLRALHLEPVLIPAIEIVPPASYAALDYGLGSLAAFDWLLFTSANGVAAYASRLGSLPEIPAPWPAHLRVAVVGAATARAAQAAGLHVDLVPPQAVAESMAEALLPFAHHNDGSPARMLLVRAEGGRDVLPGHLRQAGADVTVAAGYRTELAANSVERLRHLFSDPAQIPAAVTFTSSSTVGNLLALCEAAGLALPETVRRVSIGPVTSQTLRESGLPPHAEALEATVACLAGTVREVLLGSPRL